MHIVIAGGGRVGFHLARLLSSEHKDVTVIENDQGRLDEIDYALDVSTVKGDGSSVMLLQQVGVSNADLFVASMGVDETNLISAATAKGLGAKKVVARVDNPMYVESHILYETVLGLDFILSPDALAALEIAQYVENPGVISSEEFAHGLVQLRQVRVKSSPTKGGKTLRDVLPPGSGVLLGVINHHGKSIIPHGDSQVADGDLVTLIGHKEKLRAVQELFGERSSKPRKVAIMGGSKIGLILAQALEGRVKTVKLFESKADRAERLAERLTKAKVVCRDAVSRETLDQEHIAGFDVYVAATGDDERNIIGSVMAKEVGVDDVVAVVHQPDFAMLVERLGIDLAVTPRTSIANRIIRLVHQKEVTGMAVLGEGQIEVIEITLREDAQVTGTRLRDLDIKPGQALVAAIMREKQVVVPSGEDELRAGDHVVVIAMAQNRESVQKLFKKT
jgi:trk system potassium uptake protein TrkA